MDFLQVHMSIDRDLNHRGVMIMLRFPDRMIAPGRVFCVGSNYLSHIEEMGGKKPERCVVFMKPSTCLVQPRDKITLPRGKGQIHHEVEIVATIGKPGKNIAEREALDYLLGLSIGLDLTLRDLQKDLRKNSHPWELCKAFDQSAPIGDFVLYTPRIDPGNIDMKCLVNGKLRQKGNSREMIFSLEKLISILSQTWQLMEGDLIYTGTPSGVGPVNPGDAIQIESPQIGAFFWEMS